MNLPDNGKIVIIDDEPNDVTPLAQSLSILEKPVHLFCHFESDEFPTKPLTGVRVVFLDLELTSGISESSMPANAVGIFGKIIDKNNHPFVVIVWTDQSQLFDATRSLIEAEFKAQVVKMEKSQCKTDEKFDIKKIIAGITTQLGGLEMINLVGDWENIVHNAAIKTSEEFLNLVNYDDEWNKNVANLFTTLAKARTDKQFPDIDEKAIIDNALSMFTETFLNKIHGDVRKTQFEDSAIAMIKTGSVVTDNNIKAKINTQLLFTKVTTVNPLPGNIYENLDSGGFDKDLFIKKCMRDISADEKSELEGELQLVFLTVNAMCDYAQKKWRTLRLIPSIVIPEKFGDKIKKDKHDIYPSPLVYFKDKLSYIIFDLGSVMSIKLENNTPPNPITTLTDETLVDIQSSLASHVSRPGSSFIE